MNDRGSGWTTDAQADGLRLADPERIGELAVALVGLWRSAGAGLICVASGARRAADLQTALRFLAPDVPVVFVPPWDCLPYDRAPPSRAAMSERIAALMAVESEKGRALVIASPGAVLQRLPPIETLRAAALTVRPGDTLDPEALRENLRAVGYAADERVDELGEAALRGQVLDVFPAGAEKPVRIEHENGRVTALRRFDPVTQLTTGDEESVRLLPVSEYITGGEQPERFGGMEHWLPEAYGSLDSLAGLLPDAMVVLDVGAEERLQGVIAQVQDAFESRTKLRPERLSGRRPLPPDSLYLTLPEWHEALRRRRCLRVERADGSEGPPPTFARRRDPLQRLAAFVQDEIDKGRRVLLAAAAETDLRALRRSVKRALDRDIPLASEWSAVEGAPPGSVLAAIVPVEDGFRAGDVVVVTAHDVLGSRARQDAEAFHAPLALVATEIEFRPGDAVIHWDHGLGLLEGIETVETEGAATDLLRLRYADDATLLVPAEDMDRVWRYGAAAEGLTLDRLDGEGWRKRREVVEQEVAHAAEKLAEAVRERESRTAPKLVPPRPAYERFVDRFPYPESADQLTAIADVLADLAAGRPMSRLVCGDVGFGKTEVALRAAAAAALAGKQVALVAPTTVLVRQHVQTIERRFAGLGLAVGHLSRLVKPAEARAVKEGLADGSIRIVVGTHALVGRGIHFKDLGLVIVDEEQRFGAAHKARLQALGHGVHRLTLTATPIPRTLQAALVGLQDLSVIATPPARRQPIRTFLVPFDEATVREALLREKQRGGQSFVVCPRIEDIEPMAHRLKALVPELETVVVHGQMPADAVDDAMVRFADGDGDVLLATNIIESGLDVPRANTMLVWRPDRFGLAQLHQLRGRVGRGSMRGVAYLLTDPAHTLPSATKKRLRTLESLDRLGAGFAISAQDLDQRGAGDLFGEEQAGHVKLIGVGLYQHQLRRALAAIRGELVEAEWRPDLHMGLRGFIPAEYVPEPEMRISLYGRLAHLIGEDAVDPVEAEIEDRFGAPPEPVRRLLALTRLREACRALGVARVDAGPQAIALTFRGDGDRSFIEQVIGQSDGALAWRNERLVWSKASPDDATLLAQVTKLLGWLRRRQR
ncbi:MAG TPA: helicase-related protein [Microvirga sp.]|jgi:transcription-repair coupling factor (superfamily II helicase)